jgi:enoyl-CoA hydratase/carnithine racemase
MSIIAWEKDESVAVIVMNNGENRQNPSFVKDMLKTFDEIEEDDSIFSVVVKSSDSKCWSLGIDVQWITQAMGNKEYQSVRDFMYGLNKVFRRILLYPMPVIAAINGHAFGAGAIMSCAFDFRFMKSDRGFFCFPEVDINIPFLPSMVAIIKKAIPYYKLEELAFTGKRVTAPELGKHHVIVKACENEAVLMAESLAFAKTFHKRREIYGENKKRFHKNITDIMDKEDQAFIESVQLMV